MDELAAAASTTLAATGPELVWEAPLWGLCAGLAGLALAAAAARRTAALGYPPRAVALVAALRAVAVLVLAAILARPVWVRSEDLENRSTVVVLVDRSASMAIRDGDDGQTLDRLDRAREFLRERLAPALRDAGLGAVALLFADDARVADGPEIAAATPDGPETNLPLALRAALAAPAAKTPSPPRSNPDSISNSNSNPGPNTAPLAVVALTDGVSTAREGAGAAAAALARRGVPLVGIGVGSDKGARALALRELVAPGQSPPRTPFRVEVRLETTGEGAFAPFDLLLLRDGRLVQRRAVDPGANARSWNVGFEVSEDQPGVVEYAARLADPAIPGVRVVSDSARASVVVSEEGEIRTLYAQATLGWDYKFLKRATRDDPLLKFTGLSRTSDRSYLVQDGPAELSAGFLESVEKLAPYRVVILANYGPRDLNDAQRETLARFCGEYGGGLLLLGGPLEEWRGTSLERILPAAFSPAAALSRAGEPFRLAPTAEGLEQPALRIAEGDRNAAAWARAPVLRGFSRAESVKPGASVWAVAAPPGATPAGNRGVDGPPILISQSYGGGVVMVLATSSLWRWRLARDAEPRDFDRLVKQLIRHLGRGNREQYVLQLPDQDFAAGGRARFTVERRRRPGDAAADDDAPNPAAAAAATVSIVVERPDGSEEPPRALELAPGALATLEFPTERPGIHRVRVLDPAGGLLAARDVDVRERNPELERSARDMESLRQWAALTDGRALRIEDCDDPAAIVELVRERAEAARAAADPVRSPAWPRPEIFALLLCALCGEWISRKRWEMP